MEQLNTTSINNTLLLTGNATPLKLAKGWIEKINNKYWLTIENEEDNTRLVFSKLWFSYRVERIITEEDYEYNTTYIAYFDLEEHLMICDILKALHSMVN